MKDHATSGIGETTAEIIARLQAMRFETFPEDLRAALRVLAIDGIAVAVAGAALEPSPQILARHLQRHGASGDVSALGFGFGLGAVAAAELNAASMHVLDYEPMWRPATHALSPVLSAVLALAEERGLGGAAVMTALVRGIEIQGWLRQAGNCESRDLKFHPPGVVGPIGAATAAAALLDLDAGQTATALGMASSRCGALFTNLGTMTKATHCGQAAANGLDCALLAEAGFTATQRVFDDDRQSFIGAFMPVFDREVFLKLGQGYRILDPGFAIKFYPAKFSTHYGIKAALDLHPQITDPAAIGSVELIVADVPSSDRPNPRSGLDGKFSVQYTAAAALLDGRVGLDTFTDARLRRADMQALLPKISVTMPAEMPSLYNTGRFGEVAVTFADGRRISARCSNPPGSWGGAPVSAGEHSAKVRNCLSTRFDPKVVDEIVTLAARLDQLDGRELRRLLRLASGREVSE